MSELLQIVNSGEPTADLIFLHGLGGDAKTTWGFDKPTGWHTWIKACRPDLNIWSVDYRVERSEWTGGSMPLFDRAVNVLALLDNHVIGRDRPICFICHSLGGLIVKEMLRHARDVTATYSYIAKSAKGIIYFSTPHTGSSLADFAQKFELVFRNSIAVKELSAHHPRLRDLNIWFRNNYAGLEIQALIFFETQNTGKVRVVDETSADPGIPNVTPIPIDADHHAICRPAWSDELVVGQTLRFLDRVFPHPSYHYDPRLIKETGHRKGPRRKRRRMLVFLILIAILILVIWASSR
jgi:hypothetical protein